MSYCQNFRAILAAYDGPDMLVARARCKQWSCPHCAEVNRKQWRLRVFQAQEKLGSEWAFVTLTAHSRATDGPSSLDNLQNGWKRLSARMRRKYGAFHYIRVYEMHADGRWHWHMLVNFHFDDIAIRKQKDGKEIPYSKWMKKAAQECGLGYYTHAENMRSVAGAAKYVTKYMSKNLEGLPPGIRRIQTSQGFPKLENESELEWRMLSGVYWRDLKEAHDRRGNVIDISADKTLTTDDFLSTYIYPPEWADKP